MSIDTGDNIMTNEDIIQMLSTNGKNGQGKSCRVETVIQEPQTINQNYAVFNINSGGILDKSSRLKLNVYANGDNAQLPPISGALTLISSAQLITSQGITIASTHDFQNISTCRQCWIGEEQRKNRNSKVLGSYNVYDYHSNGTVQLMTRPDNLQIGDGIANVCEYTITIEQLFPELFPYMLPVFAISDNLQLHITFSDGDTTTGGRGVSLRDASGISPVVLDTDNVQFIADHLYFDADLMNSILQKTQGKSGLNVPYGDYNLVKTQFTSPGAIANPGNTTLDNSVGQIKQFNIGMSGLSVRYMLMMVQNQGINEAPPVFGSGELGAQQRIFGKYGSSGPIATDKEKLQLVINNVNYFQKELDTPSRFYNELEDVFGEPPSIPWGLYTNEQNYYQDAKSVLTGVRTTSRIHGVSGTSIVRNDGEYNVNLPRVLLGGGLNYKGVNFSFAHNNSVGSGMRINETPVEITYTYPWTYTDSAGSRLLRIYSCVERVMSIHNGQITVDFS
jgi:hypothetical protein